LPNRGCVCSIDFGMSVSPTLPVPLISASPADPCPVCPRIASEFEGWRLAAYWQAQHRRARDREDKLKAQNQQLQAEIRRLKQQLFGTSSETSTATQTTTPNSPPLPKRSRGQQPGRPSPAKRRHDALPQVEEIHDVPEAQRRCLCCDLPFAEFPGTEDAEILEVDVKAHRRVIRRKRYRPTCSCPENKPIIAAPPAPRVIPKSTIGVSVWVLILLDKYLFHRPTYRLLEDLRLYDLDLSLGTITDGLKRLEPLFTPLYEACVEHSQEQTLWHADETRWLVFVTREGKVGQRWYLWVFHAADVVVFVLSPTRAHEVPEAHFGAEAEGYVMVDRYSAYKAMTQVKAGTLILAFCWAHVRRDFLRVQKGNPEHDSWAAAWVQRIGRLYHLNDQRLQALAPPTGSPSRVEPLTPAVSEPQPQAPAQPKSQRPVEPVMRTAAEQVLRAHVEAMAQQRDEELAQDQLPLPQRKVLESLKNHWAGLTVFLDHPEVPLDNNTAERAERGPVVGRKNYYGSGAEWSGRLATMLFGLFQTLSLSQINPKLWLSAYLNGCAAAGGKAPEDAVRYLPWNLSDQQKRLWSSDPKPTQTDTS
jgi:transposase